MSSGPWAGGLMLLVWGGWMVTILWGSIMAVRGKRTWATIMLVVGSGSMFAGMASYGVSVFFLFSSLSSSGGSSSSIASGMAPMAVIMVVAGILFLLGVVSFTAGFVGVCARYGATEQRAAELEVLVGQLQQRMQSGV